MIGFLIIGVIGLALLLVSALLGEILDGVFDALDIGGGGLLSGPVIGAFLAAFGFGGALTMNATEVGVPGGALAGLGSGIVVGGIAFGITRSLMRMPTDETMRTSDLVGATGVVVTPIPEGSFGEVNVQHLGQTVKYNARANRTIDVGTPIEVTTVLSSSALLVKRLDDS
ncbi:hypothetical protein ER308_17235 [Egibacter rhizosphaerae]|uniref:Uncharacterized protein n=1 Tax=Egibacter rhizosphaerae TaxID=1670831 RepID=A0A411YJ16_9ACTN|nr:NfeD family protein [Egibacter rhizosphaerae]QBI21141.1 hypothetical protein ER308_17235 [Egibacter rhizosphaerae]